VRTSWQVITTCLRIGAPFFWKKGENEERYAEIPIKTRKLSQKLLPMKQIDAVGLNYSAFPKASKSKRLKMQVRFTTDR
jgi:hypothetical protein